MLLFDHIVEDLFSCWVRPLKPENPTMKDPFLYVPERVISTGRLLNITILL